ncbi:MAG: TIGR04348 family glycosyltransferase [Acidobacteria bacterium]|nr:TIGR04348 family glycosyltransferase [Acidobacteriota bacterium]
MRIGIITPAPPNSLAGNRRTALRWANLLRQLGHRVVISQNYVDQPFDVLVALHAKRSHDSINRFHRMHSHRPLIVALTGTDLYHDLRRSRQAQASLEMATRLIVLQPKALENLPERFHHKTRVIYQSVGLAVSPMGNPQSQPPNHKSHASAFQVCVIGHLRGVKDPFRAAMASRLLPATSRIQIVQVGKALGERIAVSARREMHLNPRYRWVGEQSPKRALEILRSSQLCVNSSRMEGGANSISEAIAAGVPVIASRVPGNLGLLGENYPGYFPVGDGEALARLLFRAETDEQFLAQLKLAGQNLAGKFLPEQELDAWRKLLVELFAA